MLIKSITIKNFRSYKDAVTIPIGKLTAFIGRNDIGKSTILEALDIFFNDGKGIITLDNSDVNVDARDDGDTDIVIAVEFYDLPDNIVIDATNKTSLRGEYLLDSKDNLTIVKRYPNGSLKAKKVFVRANHPTNSNCDNLLSLKQNKLREKIDELGLECDRNKNAEMRKAIWNYYADSLNLQEQEIETSIEGMKDIYHQLNLYLPLYSLFQADRSNSDKDKEAQDPMKEAVKLIMGRMDIKQKCDEIARSVSEELQRVADDTLSKLQEMNPELANSLHANIPNSEDLKWSDVFKSVSVSGDHDIPLNKRGSGVKRLVLLNFFRAEAEKRRADDNHPSIVYAIEEPETSQHIHYQKLLIDSLKQLSDKVGVQIILTTHSSFIVKQLHFSNLRLIKDDNGNRSIQSIAPSVFPYPSLNEINCKAFGDYTVEFHNELYGFVQAKAIGENANNEREGNFETWLVNKGISQSKLWIRERGGVAQPAQPATLETYIRNWIHHPENHNNPRFTEQELIYSINEMMRMIMTIIGKV